MKKVITSVMASLMLLCAGSAQAWCQTDCSYDPCAPCDPCCSTNDWYIGGFAGANWISGNRRLDCFSGKPRYETGYALAASIGRRWCNNFRYEFEYSYRRNQFKTRHNCNTCGSRKGHVWSNSYLVNAFWDLPWCNDWCLKPYVGGGIGYATQRIGFRHNSSFSFDRHNHKKNGFAWQVIAGVAYPICDNIDIALEYRFHKGRLKDVYSQNVGAALRYYF